MNIRFIPPAIQKINAGIITDNQLKTSDKI
jgi:hypothetical protein